MAKTNIGRVSVVPKGEYSSTENYKRLDVVSSDGSMYISKKDNNIGNPLTDENWWFKAVEKGEVGAQGEKPVNGVDYNTDEEKEEFKNDVVSKATEEVKGNIADAETKAIENYNKNADEKTTDYDTNASNKLKAYNDNTTTKLKEYDDNATSKVNEFNTNATNKTNSFDENATAKTNAFNSNAATKTNDFNDNYDEKMQAINEASTSIEVERIESDKRYARAIDSDAINVDNFGQVECDDDGYMKDVEIESTLPEITQDVTETSPSVNYPSEFKNIISVPTIQNSRKNILDTTNINTKLSNLNFISKVDGGLNINGTPTSTWTVIKTQNLTVPINVGTSLYFNYGKTNQLKKDNTDFNVFIRLLDKDDGILYTLNNNYSTVVVEYKIYKIAFGIQSLIIDKSYNEDIYLELEISNVEPTQFEKYIGYSKQITLPERNFLGNFNGYKNYIKDNKLKSNLKIVEFNGTENFYIVNGEEYKGFALQKNTTILASNVVSRIMLSNYFKCVNGGESWKGKNTFGFSYNDVLWFQTDDDFETIDDWKSFLAQQKEAGTPLQILYISNEEEETSLENINLLLYKGINNISVGDLKLSFKYNISIEKYIEKNNENERKISDSKYARALKTQLEDIEQTQVYAENDVVENLVIKGAQLTQDVTEQSENIILLEDYPATNNHGVDVTIKDNKITLNGTATAAFNLQLPIKYKAKSIITGDTCVGYISSGETLAGNGNVTVYGNNSKSLSLYMGSGNPNYQKRTLDNFSIQNVNLYLAANTVLNNLIIDFTLANVASLDAGIPFTPNSPSLDFPSEIKVSNERNIQISKNNIFNMANITGLNNCTIDNNILTTSPMNTYVAFKIAIASKGLFKGTVYLSFDVRVLSGTTNNLNIARFNDALTNVIKLTTIDSLNISSDWTRVKFKTTLEESYELKNIWVQIANATSAVLEVKNIMLSYYDVDYEDYFDVNDINIPLTNSAIGDYSDVIDKDKAIQNKLVQEIIFDGTENWILGNEKEKTKVFHISINMTAVYGIGICNYLPYKSNLDEELINYAGNAIYIAINKTRLSNAEELKALLAQLYQLGKPMKLYLIRQDAIKISLPEEVKQELDKFKLYDDLNNVFIDNGNLSFKYNKSLSKELEEKDEMIDNLLTRVQALEAAQLSQVGGN